MENISNYNKHTTLSERIKIENELINYWYLRAISKEIYKSVSTISKEIKNCRYKGRSNFFNFTPRKCPELAKAPFVYNSCPNVKKGIEQTTTEFKELDKLVKKVIDKGHSFALILHNRKSRTYKDFLAYLQSTKATYYTKINTVENAYKLIFDYIEEFYNLIRIHSSIGYLSPNQFESQSKN